MIIYKRNDGVVKNLKNNLKITTNKGEVEIYPRQKRDVLEQIKFCLSLNEVRNEIKGGRIK